VVGRGGVCEWKETWGVVAFTFVAFVIAPDTVISVASIPPDLYQTRARLKTSQLLMQRTILKQENIHEED